VLREAARRHADREALVVRHQGVRLDYRSFDQRVDDLAAGLHRLGLRRGDRIGIWSPNNLEWVLAQFATARLGLILVNVNPAYRLSEIEYAPGRVGCRALVSARRFRNSDTLAMLRELLPELADSRPGELRSVILIGEEPAPGCLSFAELASRADPAQVEETREPGAVLETVETERCTVLHGGMREAMIEELGLREADTPS